PADETATTFIDVPDTAWYAGYTAAAAGAGLVKGYEDGSFRPHRPVTREELAVILVRGLELTARPGATLPFNDAEEVFTWAKDSVTIAAGCGLLHGYPDGTFRPRGQVTRAESAVMLYRALCNEIK
ncbi:MAG: S-layer homology domain-containing protein, partial [Peptococcaceae bacterium]|nr:S-layer homology domain-containing protein [Peptococcaceae bacterium]